MYKRQIDYQVARALSADVVCTPAFRPVEEDAIRRAKALIAQAGYFLNAGVDIGEYNQFQRTLIEYADSLKKPRAASAAELIETITAPAPCKKEIV